jgi:hypothetical protein
MYLQKIIWYKRSSFFKISPGKNRGWKPKPHANENSYQELLNRYIQLPSKIISGDICRKMRIGEWAVLIVEKEP